MISGQIVRSLSPSSPNRGPGSQALQASIVIRAATGERILGEIVRQADMPHPRVHQAMNQLAVNAGTASNAGTNCEINEIPNILRSAPTRFSKRCRIHVGLEGNRYV